MRVSAAARRTSRAPASLSTSVAGKATRVTTAPVSSLSSLPSPSQSQSTEFAVTLSDSAPASTRRPLTSTSSSARQLFTSPARRPRAPTKTCPVCRKPQLNLGQHLESKACNQHLTNAQAKAIGYVRCEDCDRWVHTTRLRGHREQHTCVVAVYPHGRSPPPVPASPVTPVEQDRGEIKELVFDNDDSDVDSQATVPVDFQDFPQSPVASSPVSSVGTLLPESFQSWPHLFTYVPRKAQELWTQACSQALSDIRDVYLERGVCSDVDQLILKFLLLPRLLLRRVAGQSHADKKLARTLFTYLRDKQVPHVPQQHNDSNKDTRSDAARRVSAATRKVRQGHVHKAV